MTLEELHRTGVSLLRHAGEPAQDARALLLWAAEVTDLDFTRDPRRPVGRRARARYLRRLRRRRDGAPLAYLTGRREFWSLLFEVGPGVLIPRPETELLVELVLAGLDGGAAAAPRILDLGTGSGCIALALASEIPAARITATDVSRRALRFARRNGRRLAPGRVSFISSNFFSELKRGAAGPKFDVIVSNPPYVAEEEWRSLEAGVRDYEPREAFVPGATGLEALGRIIADSPDFLAPGGRLILEMGFGQGEAVLALFDGRWHDVECHHDLRGLPRAVAARLRPSEEANFQGGGKS